jgi:probable rRNA maturation factor
MGRIDLSVVSDEEIRRINREHRGIDKVTDVLSFRLSEDETFGALADIGESSEYLGDILICLPQVRRQAREIGRSSATELALMVAHGTLHLLGYDHCDLRDETRMFGLQQETLMRLNYL